MCPCNARSVALRWCTILLEKMVMVFPGIIIKLMEGSVPVRSGNNYILLKNGLLVVYSHLYFFSDIHKLTAGTWFYRIHLSVLESMLLVSCFVNRRSY